MKRYQIEITPAARKTLAATAAPLRLRLDGAIQDLAVNPRPPGVKKLTESRPTLYRIRVGDHRIVYEVRDAVLIVLVVRIGHRREVYR